MVAVSYANVKRQTGANWDAMMTILKSDLHRAEDCVAAAKHMVGSLKRKLQAGSEAASQECLSYWEGELSAAKAELAKLAQ